MLTAKYTRRLLSGIKWMIPLIMAIALLFGTSGCGKSAAQPEATTAAFELVETTAALQSSAAQQPGAPVMTAPSQDDKTISQSEASADITEAYTEENAEEAKEESIEETTEETAEEPEESSAAANEPSVTEDGEYTSKEEVAEYIHLFGHLPSNFITKKEAKALGWEGGDSLGKLAPGKSIGGDRFGNYEGQLPEEKGRKYTECDIDYKGKKRNAKRIVFSNDGLIFYTDDHYKTFEQLY